jgi:translation initiation factor 5
MHLPQLMISKNQTVISNASLIASEIGRPLTLIAKFLSKLIGARVSVKNRDKQDVLIISGTGHTVQKVSDALFEYINHRVLCPRCGNPETNVDLTSCKACGDIGKIKKVIPDLEIVFE